ncbi:flippase [candidate division KSB1 bacterium]|nr:flippase [candidate division KSB1 bacterium]
MNLKNVLIAKNASILLVTDVVSKALLTVLTIVIGRKLGASDLGLLKYAIAFAGMFSFLPNAGFKQYINREVSKFPEKSGVYFSNLAGIKLILSLITFLIIYLSAFATHVTHEEFLILCIAAWIMLLDSFIQFYTAFFRGFQKSQYEALVIISQNFLVASTGIVIVVMGYGLLLMMIVRLAITVTMVIAGFLLLKSRIIHPPFTINFEFCRKLVRSAIPFTILTILVVINAHIGIVLLKNFKGTDYTGFYGAALSLCGIFQFIPQSVAGAILPAMARYAKEKNTKGLQEIFSRSIKYLLILVFPIAAGTTLLADKLILMIYGELFVQSILTLRILIWIVVLSFTNSIFNVAFASIDLEKKFVRVQIMGTVSNISLCIVLIPIFAHNGVAAAAIVSQLMVFIVSSFYLSRLYEQVKFSAFGWKVLAAAVVMVVGISLTSSLHLFFNIGLAIPVYACSLFLFKVFDAQEIDMLKSGIARVVSVVKSHSSNS